MNELAMKANNLGFKSYCLTSSTNSGVDEFRNKYSRLFMKSVQPMKLQ